MPKLYWAPNREGAQAYYALPAPGMIVQVRRDGDEWVYDGRRYQSCELAQLACEDRLRRDARALLSALGELGEEHA